MMKLGSCASDVDGKARGFGVKDLDVLLDGFGIPGVCFVSGGFIVRGVFRLAKGLVGVSCSVCDEAALVLGGRGVAMSWSSSSYCT